jgi:hypothetical protein
MTVNQHLYYECSTSVGSASVDRSVGPGRSITVMWSNLKGRLTCTHKQCGKLAPLVCSLELHSLSEILNWDC